MGMGKAYHSFKVVTGRGEVWQEFVTHIDHVCQVTGKPILKGTRCFGRLKPWQNDKHISLDGMQQLFCEEYAERKRELIWNI